MSRGTRSLRAASQRVFLLFFKIFAAIFRDQQTAPGSPRMLWSLFRKWSSVGNVLCRLSPSTRSGHCLAVHVIGVKVQDLTIAFCDNFLTSDTPRRYQQGFHFRQKGTKRFLLRQLVRVLSFSHALATRAFLCWTRTDSERHPF